MQTATQQPTRNIIHAMASVMREKPGSNAADLKLEGFTERQIELHGPAAAELANSQSETRI
jgi:hypothetical protein